MKRIKGMTPLALLVLIAIALAGPDEPPSADVEWPPYVQDADPDTPGDQPGYDTSAPNPYDENHTKGEWQFRVHVKPGTTSTGEAQQVCDAHFVLPGKPASNEGKITQGNSGWSGGKPDDDSNTFHFHAADCEANPMPVTGLTFTFWATSGNVDALAYAEIILTSNGEAETPPAGSDDIVGIIRKTSTGKRIPLPITLSVITPTDTGLEWYDDHVLVSLGQQLDLDMASGLADADYAFHSALSIDAEQTDPSESGVNAVTDPVPAAWGIAYGEAQGWVNSDGTSVNSVSVGTDPDARANTVYVVSKLTDHVGTEEPMRTNVLRIFVKHSETDWDGDGFANPVDAAPLDSEEW